MHKETIIRISDGEVEDLVKAAYQIDRKTYSFVATEECGNDSSHAFTVTNSVPDEYEAGHIRSLKEGIALQCPNYLILNSLCIDGLLEPGEYLVEVCW